MNFRNSIFGDLPPVTKNLLIINALFLLASYTLGSKGIVDINEYLGLHYWEAKSFNPAQVITYMFLHAGFLHFFFNMFALWMFGKVVEQLLGSKKFLFFYIVCGIGAAIVQEATWTYEISGIVSQFEQLNGKVTPEMIAQESQFMNQFITIGASGSIFGVLLAFGMLLPNIPLYIMFIPIPIKAKYCIIGYAVIELFMGVANTSGDNVAHYAHLGGMLFGLILLLYWKKKGQMHL